MVFPRPAGRCLCGHSSSNRCRLSVAWSFLAGNRLFKGQLHQQQQQQQQQLFLALEAV